MGYKYTTSSPLPDLTANLIHGNWGSVCSGLYHSDHIYGVATTTSYELNLYSLLTFTGGLRSDTFSLSLTDISHHHLGLGIVIIWGACLFSSIGRGFGYILFTGRSLSSSRETIYPGGVSNASLSLSLSGVGVLV
jgi:hypothetical protein